MPSSLPRLALSRGGVRGEVDARHLTAMRPVLGKAPLVRDGWIFELKLDGFRAVADVRRSAVVLRYRSGHDCTPTFPEIASALGRLRISRVVLDGELVAFDDRGRPDFDRMRARMHPTRAAKPAVSYHVFDVLAVGDVDLRQAPLVARKQILARIIAGSNGALREVPYVA